MKGFDESWLRDYERRTGLKATEQNGPARDRAAVPAADVEPHPVHVSDGAHAAQGFDQRVRISVHSIRRRLSDPDGVSAKAVIDGLVLAGIIRDDGPEEVASVSFSQERGKPERTVITIIPEKP